MDTNEWGNKLDLIINNSKFLFKEIMEEKYFLLIVLYSATFLLTLLPFLALYFCRDRHFYQPIKVPPPPLQTRKTFKMENRFKSLDPMIDSSKADLPKIE